MGSLPLTEKHAELLASLLREKVEFTVVGGYAVCFHGFVRPVNDLDLLVSPSERNASCIAKALQDFHFHFPSEYLKRMSDSKANCILPGELNAQLLGHIVGVDTLEAVDSSVTYFHGDLEIPIISLSHLAANKRATGRPKDISDMAGLTKAP